MSKVRTQGLLGVKLGMTQIFEEGGLVRGVTAIEAGPCTITQVKTPEVDGYTAVQLGFHEKKHLNKPETGHLKGLGSLRTLREVRLDSWMVWSTARSWTSPCSRLASWWMWLASPKARASPVVSSATTSLVDQRPTASLTATGLPAPSVPPPRRAASTKDLRMAGHMGDERVTVQNLKVIQVDPGAQPAAAGRRCSGFAQLCHLRPQSGEIRWAKEKGGRMKKMSARRGVFLMPQVPVYNIAGEVVDNVDLNDKIFGAPIKAIAIHQAAIRQMANLRQGTADTKTRGEVSGGGAKPWRQKGTGRARQGSTRSPQWRHGGVVFGPHPTQLSPGYAAQGATGRGPFAVDQ